ncbi:AMP-binding protein [Nocardia cyriacigeorgica]|uniref:AMP-binding protein n=1 Tax=Nocardia cyriacigeorgica TaxID=135487 RepID=UPI001893FF58|nr:AMP-binding protein [Nocardia cyriacigeorgica]MBF6436577.1 AMP-binding protein [Nocardia cyriacigeorgica]
MKSVAEWLLEPVADGGLALCEGSEWAHHPYPVLADESFGAVETLREHGIHKGDRVALLLPSGAPFVRFFFAAMAMGAVPTVVAPPGLHGSTPYADYVRALLCALDPAAVIAEPATLRLLPPAPWGAVAAPARIDATAPVAAGSATVMDPVLGDETALIQFTSGSTSTPRAVRLSAGSIVAHIDMLKAALYVRGAHQTESFGSWLPLHHDMGLIGNFLTPVSHGKDLWLMRPEQFVRRPGLWLELFGKYAVNHSAAPNFAIERIVRTVSAKSLAGMNFADWRTLIVGSDRISLGAMRALYELLEPFGFGADVITPGYGMAETTLAVSTTRREPVQALLVDAASLRAGAPVRVRATETLREPVQADADVVRVVDCGVPLPGAAVSVADEDGNALGEDHIGELVVESPALFSGYLNDGADGGQPRRYATGDLGFCRDGRVYVLGRLGNSVKVNGQFVTAEDLEIALAERLGMPHDKIVVVLRDLGAQTAPAVLIAFQQRLTEERTAKALTVLARSGISAERAALATVAPLAIPRTTSGKPKRIPLWEAIESGAVAAKWGHVGSDSPLWGCR